jgi:hypothetical protein
MLGDVSVRIKEDFMSKSNSTLPPGSRTPRSGIYDMVGPRAGATGEQKVSTYDKPLPPTDKPGQGYRLARPAHHQPKK